MGSRHRCMGQANVRTIKKRAMATGQQKVSGPHRGNREWRQVKLAKLSERHEMGCEGGGRWFW